MKFKSDIEIQAGVEAGGSTGSNGQVLSSTGSSVAWINQGDISIGEAEVAKSLQVTVKNVSGGELTKGTVVHTAPTASPPSGNVIEVIAADYDDTTKMPAIGILKETIANEEEGEAVMTGALSGIATDGFSIGDELYVGADGALTNVKPQTAGQLIQKIAVCVKSHASNGLIKIFGAGRSNDVPLPLYIDNTHQRLGIGTASPSGRLDVQENTTGDLLARVWNTNTSGTGDSILRIANSGNNADGNRIEFSDQNYYTATISGDRSQGIVFRTSATGTSATGIPERMRIEPDGIISIGEGTTQSWIYNKVQATTTAVSGRQDMSNIDRTTANWMRITNPVYSTDGSVGLIMRTFPNSDARQGAGIIASGGSDNAATDLDLFVSQQTSGTTTSTSYSAISIKGNTGNVGIGTTNPLSNLQVGPGTTNSGSPVAMFGGAESGILSALSLVNTEGNTAAGNGTALDFHVNPGYSPTGRIATIAETISTEAALSFYTYNSGLNEKMRITSSGNVGIGTTDPGAKLDVAGDVKINSALLSNQANTNVDTGAEVVAQVSTSTYTAAFFDFVIKKVGNIRSGTVYACHDGINVEFTETSTNDLGDTSDVTLSVDKSGTNLRLIATVTSDDWIIKSLIRGI